MVTGVRALVTAPAASTRATLTLMLPSLVEEKSWMVRPRPEPLTLVEVMKEVSEGVAVMVNGRVPPVTLTLKATLSLK